MTFHRQYGPKATNYAAEFARQEVLRLARVASEDWENSIFVEHFPAIYYQKVNAGSHCSCRFNKVDKTKPIEQSQTANTKQFTVTGANPFGNRQTSAIDNLFDQPELNDLVIDTANGQTGLLDEESADTVACGICLRSGYEQGYQLAQGQRFVLTAQNLKKLWGKAHVVQGQKPVTLKCPSVKGSTYPTEHHMFQNQATADGVSWEIEVPAFFSSCRATAYNNVKPVDARIYLIHPDIPAIDLTDSEQTINDSDVYGLTAVIGVVCSEFTHILLEFDDFASNPVKISCPQLAKAKNYDNFENISDQSLILSSRSVTNVAVDDLIWLPTLHLMFKVTGATPLTVMDGFKVGWTAESRLIQINEVARCLTKQVAGYLPIPR